MFNLIYLLTTNLTVSCTFMSMHVHRTGVMKCLHYRACTPYMCDEVFTLSRLHAVHACWSVYTIAPARRTCPLFSTCLKECTCTCAKNVYTIVHVCGTCMIALTPFKCTNLSSSNLFVSLPLTKVKLSWQSVSRGMTMHQYSLQLLQLTTVNLAMTQSHNTRQSSLIALTTRAHDDSSYHTGFSTPAFSVQSRTVGFSMLIKSVVIPHR